MKQSKVLLFFSAASFVVFIPMSGADAQSSIGSGNPMNQLSMPEKQIDPIVQQRREEVEREYRATKGALPMPAGTIDPWANMRGADETMPAAKSAQKQSATATKKKPAQ